MIDYHHRPQVMSGSKMKVTVVSFRGTRYWTVSVVSYRSPGMACAPTVIKSGSKSGGQKQSENNY